MPNSQTAYRFVPRIKLDPVWASLALAALGAAAFFPALGTDSARFVLRAVDGILPVFALSVALSAWLHAAGADNLIARAFVGRTSATIALAALAGALSPFCSCGVIPVIAALLAIGVPLPPVMAFWLASPLMDPAMFLVTAGTLGTTFALGKTLAAIGVGLVGGFGTLALSRFGALAQPLRDGVGNGGCGGAIVRSPKEVVWAIWREPARVRKFLTKAAESASFLGKWLLVAFVLESLMLRWLPAEQVSALLGGNGLGAILMAVAVGVPAYLNGYAALPLVAGLIAKGMAPGVGMAFLVAGGVTSTPAMLAVAAVARVPVFAAYLAFSVVGATLAGYLYGLGT